MTSAKEETPDQPELLRLRIPGRDPSLKKFNPMQLYDERSISPKTPKLAILKSKTTPNILSRIMEQVGKFREQPRSASLTSYDPAWFVMWLWHIHCFYDCEINKNQHFFKIKKDARTKNAPKMDWAVRGTLIDAKKYSFKDRNFFIRNKESEIQ